MLAGIKKAVVGLSGLCVLLTVVEECFQRMYSSNSFRVKSGYLGSSPTLKRTPANDSSLPQQIMVLGYSPSNVSFGISKHADVGSQHQDKRLTLWQNSTSWLDLSKFPEDIVRDMSQEARSTSKHSHSNMTMVTNFKAYTHTQVEESEDAEIRRLRQSPFIILEDQDDNRYLKPPVSSSSVKLVSQFVPEGDTDNFAYKPFDSCVHRCRYVSNMSLADGVLFRASRIRDHIIPHFYRPPGQRWIFYTNDPAVKQYSLDRSDVKDSFNWTITYQLDSDFPKLFGRLRRRKPPVRDYETLFDRKSKQAAWFVSHCSTWGKRELYVERMQKILAVDVFGGCGNLSCGPVHFRLNDSTQCLPMLTQHYKFYLAFENSFCKDYISEKFFKLFQNVDVVPVVRGGFDYKKYLPSGIFVNAADFQTPEELAGYLLRLGQDKDRYMAMLRKKSQWLDVGSIAFHCLVCQALHTSQPTSHYPNLKTKFNGKPSNCWPPRDLA